MGLRLYRRSEMWRKLTVVFGLWVLYPGVDGAAGGVVKDEYKLIMWFYFLKERGLTAEW